MSNKTTTFPPHVPVYAVTPRLCPRSSTLHHAHISQYPYFISSLNHHLYTDDTKLFLSFRPSSLHDPLGRRHWSLFFTHKLSRVSKSLTALFGMRHLTYGTLPPSLRVPCQSATSECSPPSPGSDSAPKSVVGVSHRVFHSRLKTHLFSRSFLPYNLPLSVTDWFHGFILHVYGSLWRWKHWSVRQIKPALLAFGRTLI